MDKTVFDVFQTTDYTFHLLSRGSVTGNTIVSSHDANGVFKLRTGFVRNDNNEVKTGSATLHVRPTEAFLEAINNNLVGHGVTVGGKDYEIVDQTGGANFHTGVMEHYTAILQETDYSDWVQS